MKEYSVIFYIRGVFKGGIFIYSDNEDNARELIERLYSDINYSIREFKY